MSFEFCDDSKIRNYLGLGRVFDISFNSFTVLFKFFKLVSQSLQFGLLGAGLHLQIVVLFVDGADSVIQLLDRIRSKLS
jgi:hypothetical protein